MIINNGNDNDNNTGNNKDYDDNNEMPREQDKAKAQILSKGLFSKIRR